MTKWWKAFYIIPNTELERPKQFGIDKNMKAWMNHTHIHTKKKNPNSISNYYLKKNKCDSIDIQSWLDLENLLVEKQQQTVLSLIPHTKVTQNG